jgi:hypothetical protein
VADVPSGLSLSIRVDNEHLAQDQRSTFYCGVHIFSKRLFSDFVCVTCPDVRSSHIQIHCCKTNHTTKLTLQSYSGCSDVGTSRQRIYKYKNYVLGIIHRLVFN